jgi:F-type H+-transporting ATPase subunit b
MKTLATLEQRRFQTRLSAACRLLPAFFGKACRIIMSFGRRRLMLAVSLIGWVVLQPGAALAAEEGNKWGDWYVIGRFFNLALVIAVLVWVARKPLANFFASRTQTIREQLAEAQAAQREAEAKLAEMTSRMSRRDEYQRILSAAARDADRVVERARAEIEGMTRAAHLELKIHAAELSVRQAEEMIRREITDEDRGRLFAGFVGRLGENR